jgi:hypothetical protein
VAQVGAGKTSVAAHVQQVTFRVKRNLMADDPRKKKADGKRKSQQPHELAYRKRKAKMQRGQAKK